MKQSNRFSKQNKKLYENDSKKSVSSDERTNLSKTKKQHFSSDLTKGSVLLPGRQSCLCEANQHGLINNCLNCGRIVCEQEGSGPCFTCNSWVCTPEEQEQINRNQKTGNSKLYFALNDEKQKQKLDNAVKHKNKLLEYDRTVEKRTKVIDDESELGDCNDVWQPPEIRKILQKKQEQKHEARHAIRKTQKLTIDFAGRQVLEETDEIIDDVDELLKSDISIYNCKDAYTDDIYNYKLEYEGAVYNGQNRMEDHLDERQKIRLQDGILQRMSDEGLCLSLHQPYASLLIAGIKKHEGRKWYTCHRGRLWIHAAGKFPTNDEITEVENFYRKLIGSCKFPENYPAGCLVGCVELVDCLPQEEYRKQFPEGECASPFVFVCENPQELLIKFPMKGKHKIFKMDREFHHAARKSLKVL